DCKRARRTDFQSVLAQPGQGFLRAGDWTRRRGCSGILEGEVAYGEVTYGRKEHFRCRSSAGASSSAAVFPGQRNQLSAASRVAAESAREVGIDYRGVGSACWGSLSLAIFFQLRVDRRRAGRWTSQLRERAVSGHVIKLNVDDNQYVEKGTLLVEIDPVDYEVAVERARADFAAAAAQIEQAQSKQAQAEADLRTAQTAPQTMRATRARALSAQASADRKRADLHQAELNLEYTKIVAPVTGIVTNRTVEVGQNV